MNQTQVTILNSMAGRSFEHALDQHVSWDLKHLDLKDAIFDKGIVDLTPTEAKAVATLIQERDLSVYCFSTGLFGGNIESGEEKFRADYLRKIDHVIEIADILKPQLIRLLSAQTTKRKEVKSSIAYIRADQPWLIALYGETIDRLYSSGFGVTIENEVGGCILSTPQEITTFFTELDRPEKVCLTWDVQNLWQMGTFPTLEVYHQLKDWIGYYHLKGGQHSDESTTLCWRSALEDASWPVVEITQQVVSDGVSPVICLNPSHGRPKEGYDYRNIVQRDLDFVRRVIVAVE